MRNLQLLVILVLIIFAVSLIQEEGLGSKQIQKKNIMTPIPTPTPISIPTSIPSTSTPIPSSQINMSSFVYPGSIILNQSGDEMTLQSTDDPQAITNWYKEKITGMGMNAKSFVQTNTNGNVLNKLIGAKAGFKVKIQIEKNSSGNITAIKVSLG
ncbi:MAG: hypothetical protein A2860_00705 [Candidatus Levybacteria bacterium RIFCSPHIGHO2_01_FULL_37_33]|nr:MAG: hypothetical protein A2860_00705 [Candidatus Levybacteria bacterium RIFCSPHIGHO2_01_FULL_37_33]OGH30095.1 MAG: hypothetical protein A3F30_03925 [Candidatus Levybacteria bacterium RIFCSPHIGHO2_12_FULL_37_12]OGH32420.1 MAG: hypothetical protein A2953_03205 [Candidatus Levybacteria bacterium RIFCSPLOWO2_01_FULL_36_54]